MLIGELVERSGLTKDTIRYYERERLFSPPERQANNYKDYTAETVHLLRFVKQLQSGGFTLAEIRSLLRESERSSLTCGEVAGLVDRKIAEIDERIEALKLAKERLRNAFGGCEGTSDEDVCTPIENRRLSS